MKFPRVAAQFRPPVPRDPPTPVEPAFEICNVSPLSVNWRLLQSHSASFVFRPTSRGSRGVGFPSRKPR